MVKESDLRLTKGMNERRGKREKFGQIIPRLVQYFPVLVALLLVTQPVHYCAAK